MRVKFIATNLPILNYLLSVIYCTSLNKNIQTDRNTEAFVVLSKQVRQGFRLQNFLNKKKDSS